MLQGVCKNFDVYCHKNLAYGEIFWKLAAFLELRFLHAFSHFVPKLH